MVIWNVFNQQLHKLLPFPSEADTEPNETAKPFTFNQFKSFLSYVLSSSSVHSKNQRFSFFISSIEAIRDDLIDYFNQHAEEADVGEVAGFFSEGAKLYFNSDYVEDEDWYLAEWIVECFYRMQVGDFSIFDAFVEQVPLLQVFIKQTKNQKTQLVEERQNSQFYEQNDKADQPLHTLAQDEEEQEQENDEEVYDEHFDDEYDDGIDY